MRKPNSGECSVWICWWIPFQSGKNQSAPIERNFQSNEQQRGKQQSYLPRSIVKEVIDRKKDTLFRCAPLKRIFDTKNNTEQNLFCWTKKPASDRDDLNRRDWRNTRGFPIYLRDKTHKSSGTKPGSQETCAELFLSNRFYLERDLFEIQS